MKSRPRHRIAIVDDDASVRRALRRALESMDHEPVTYASGEELLHSDDVSGFDCLLLDHRMGGMSGLELSEVLSAAGHRVPRILLTADSDSPGVARRGRGMQLLAKPVDAAVLRKAIESVLPMDQRPMHEKLRSP